MSFDEEALVFSLFFRFFVSLPFENEEPIQNIFELINDM